MKLSKKILVSVASGVFVFNCNLAVSAVKTSPEELRHTVTRSGLNERRSMVFDTVALIGQFRNILDKAQEAVRGIQNDYVHCQEYRYVLRRNINRIFSQIYRDIFKPAFEFSLENYSVETHVLVRKYFVPSFLIYSGKDDHMCDIERFTGFVNAISSKLKRDGNIYKAIDAYGKSYPTFLDTAKEILDNSVEELDSILQDLPAGCFFTRYDSDEESDCEIFDSSGVGATQDEVQVDQDLDLADDLAGEFIVHSEDDGNAQESQAENLCVESDSSPSSATELGNCLLDFFRRIFS